MVRPATARAPPRAHARLCARRHGADRHRDVRRAACAGAFAWQWVFDRSRRRPDGRRVLLGIDCVARAIRIQLATWAAGGRVSFQDALRLNLYGEAASSLTPNRLGGEPARFLGMTWSGLRPVTALVALGVEVAAEWPVFGVVAVALAAYYVPDWSEAADRFLTHSLARDLLGIELIALVVLLVIWGLQRLVRPGALRPRVRRQWRVALPHVRRAPWWGVFCGGLFIARESTRL